MQTYVARDGRQIGNYGEEQLRSLYERGHLLPTDHYWREGMSEWSTLDQLLPPQPVAKLAPRPETPEEGPPPSWLIALLSVGGAMLVGLILLGFIVAHHHQRVTGQQVADEMNKLVVQTPQQQQPVETTGNTEATQLSSEIKKLQDLSKSQSPEERMLTEETVAIIEDVSKHGQGCRDAEKDMLELGFAPAKLTSMAEIEKRRQAIQSALPTLQAMIVYITNINTKIRADLLARGATFTATDGFIASMLQSGKTDALLTYWKQEIAISNDLLANLDLLKKHYGEWHLEFGKVLFDNPAILDLYQANIDKLKSDIAAQQSVQSDLLKSTLH